MKHLWLRAEHRENEKRVGLTPQGATQLIKKGIKVSVEASDTRIISTKDYKDCLLYTSPSPRDRYGSRMPSSA